MLYYLLADSSYSGTVISGPIPSIRSHKFARDLTDRSPRLQTLQSCLLACTDYCCPLVLHGAQGSGRTSTVSAVCELCEFWLNCSDIAIVARVLSSSPASHTVDYVLSTVCHQISQVEL